MSRLSSINPTTGAQISELEMTPIEGLPRVFEAARGAQAAWGALSPKARARHLLQLRETLLNHIDDVAELISTETGKPVFEAMIHELLPSVETLSYFAGRGPALLRDRKIPLSLMRHRTSYLNYWPLGVVAVISPWNFPFYLPFADIVMALIAGNAVVFKPSEVTPLVGLKIQELVEEAGLPSRVLQTVIGDGALGSAIVQQRPSKIFFTGSVLTGKKVMAAASEHLIPVNLELGGKDAMLVLPDANLDLASSAALWGGFSNSGQACASVERILVHESVADAFTEKLRSKIEALRQGPSSTGDNDLGAITHDKQKAVYESHLEQARSRGATFISGGSLSPDRRYLKPTLVTGPEIESLDIYKEETFGPVIALTRFRSIDEAIAKANRSRYGLTASIMTRNHSLGEDIAKRLEVGTVTLNEVMYTAGLPETPWGGVKETGLGRTHSDAGLLEFVNVRHIHKPRSRLLVFKAPWWFPYTDYQFATFRKYFEMYRRSRLDRLKAFPHLLWNLVQFLKRERRL